MTRWPAALLVGSLAITGSLVSAGCHAGGRPSPTLTIHSTVTSTLPAPAPTFTPPPATTVAPLPPGARPRAGEVERRCPYIASTPQQNPSVNVADINGSHVLRTTVITSMNPVGCRFYFYAPPYQAMVDITTRRFSSASEAYNAVVLTARAGTDAEGQPHIAPGVDAVLYRTRFFGPDGSRDWACAFATGDLLVIVHTDRFDTEFNALQLAKAIAGKF